MSNKKLALNFYKMMQINLRKKYHFTKVKYFYLELNKILDI